MKSINQYEIFLKEMKINSEKAKKKNLDEYVQTEEIISKKIESIKTNMNCQNTQTDLQQISNMNTPKLRKTTHNWPQCPFVRPYLWPHQQQHKHTLLWGKDT